MNIISEKEVKEAIESMREAGVIMRDERGDDFSFGEWAGESEKEIIERETGFSMDDFSDDDIDEMLDAYLGI